MGWTLDRFAAECHQLLTAEPGPKGREKVVETLRQALADKDFVAETIPEGTPERKVIYQDPELGFCILAHAYEGAKMSQPHDHASSWAIYGQAAGETLMSDYEKLEPAKDGEPGKVRVSRSYSLTPGVAYLYNEGDLHAPKREAATKLIRIEGMNMTGVKRDAYVVV